jgi:putative methyltransferase
LFTKRGITVRNDVPLKQCVVRHQGRLKSELTKIKVKKGVSSNEDLVSQKVKDAGNNKNMYFTRKGEY